MTELLTYLLDQEKEERNERRALEQRAAGLILALLVALPVAGNLAGQTDRAGLGIAGLIGTGVALVAALAIAGRIAAQLSVKDAAGDDAPSRATLRDEVATALERGDEAGATTAQRRLVAKLRSRNQALAERVKSETALLPGVLLLFLVSLALMAIDPKSDDSAQSPCPRQLSVMSPQ